MNNNSSIKKHIENIAKLLYGNICETELSLKYNEDLVFPNESNKKLISAIKKINIYKLPYAILHSAYNSGKYYLVLTKYNNKIYKVFYNYTEDNKILYYYKEYYYPKILFSI